MRPFEITDCDVMNEWRLAHGERAIDIRELPSIGYFEPGVAAGFLCLTDADFAVIEGFVTNPISDSRIRHEALISITNALIFKAKQLKYSRVIAFTKNIDIEKRATTHGFSIMDRYTLMVKEV